MPGFQDHFSGHARDYASYRPRYPLELFTWLSTVAPARRVAWDVATGNGQAAVPLAEHFERVLATDGSVRQLASAEAHDRVFYAAALAERAPLADGSTDLTVVAQALHWFETSAFYDEVRRVSSPGAVFGAIVYTGFEIDPGIDRITHRFYDETVRAFWPPERRHVESGYETLPFPFRRMPTPRFQLHTRWDLNDLLSYIRTWSALRRFIEARRTDPTGELAVELAEAWGDVATPRIVRWDLRILVGRV
jgi:hypothetical protein